jgi:hypothetical protein
MPSHIAWIRKPHAQIGLLVRGSGSRQDRMLRCRQPGVQRVQRFVDVHHHHDVRFA